MIGLVGPEIELVMHHVEIIVGIGQPQIFQILLPLQIMLVLQILRIMNICVWSIIRSIYLGSKVRGTQNEQNKQRNRRRKCFHRLALLQA